LKFKITKNKAMKLNDEEDDNNEFENDSYGEKEVEDEI
jgi:hypothetical protein